MLANIKAISIWSKLTAVFAEPRSTPPIIKNINFFHIGVAFISMRASFAIAYAMVIRATTIQLIYNLTAIWLSGELAAAAIPGISVITLTNIIANPILTNTLTGTGNLAYILNKGIFFKDSVFPAKAFSKTSSN